MPWYMLCKPVSSFLEVESCLHLMFDDWFGLFHAACFDACAAPKSYEYLFSILCFVYTCS